MEMSEGRSIEAEKNKIIGGPSFNKEEIMSRKRSGIVMIIVGVALVVVSLAADRLGIGNGAGVGWKQIAGMVAGVLVVGVGIMWGWRKPGKGG